MSGSKNSLRTKGAATTINQSANTQQKVAALLSLTGRNLLAPFGKVHVVAGRRRQLMAVTRCARQLNMKHLRRFSLTRSTIQSWIIGRKCWVSVKLHSVPAKVSQSNSRKWRVRSTETLQGFYFETHTSSLYKRRKFNRSNGRCRSKIRPIVRPLTQACFLLQLHN